MNTINRKRKFELSTFTPKTFALDEEEAYLKYLEKEGYVVIRNILTKEEQEERLELFWNAWTHVSPGFNRLDSSTWSIETSPMMYHKGMASFSGFSQSELMWSLRLHPNIKGIYSKVYKTTDLAVSFNAFSVFFDADQKSSDWWHIDQHPNNKSYCVQGSYNFFPVTDDSAGFVCVPRSHLKSIGADSKTDRDWILLPEDDPYVRDEGVKLLIPENCFVLWNSRLIHANTGISRNKKEKKEKKEEKTLDRLTCFVSFMPKALRSEEIRDKRLLAYENATALSHWAIKCDIKKYPWGFGPRYESRGFRTITPILPIPEERMELI